MVAPASSPELLTKKGYSLPVAILFFYLLNKFSYDLERLIVLASYSKWLVIVTHLLPLILLLLLTIEFKKRKKQEKKRRFCPKMMFWCLLIERKSGF